MTYQVGAAPAEMPKTAPMNKVELKASRRPTMSEAIPQNEAPIVRPMNVAKVVKRTFVVLMPNSYPICGRVWATPCRADQLVSDDTEVEYFNT